MNAIVIAILVLTAIFWIVMFLRSYVQNSWGELRFMLVGAERRLMIAKASKDEKMIELDKKEIEILESKINHIEKKWKIFFRGRVITCFDSLIFKERLGLEEEMYSTDDDMTSDDDITS